MKIPEYVVSADANDELSTLRNRFSIPDGIIYLDGNSLGPLPTQVSPAVQNAVDHQWGSDLITSWNSHNWIDLPIIAGEKIAEIVGACPGQVICCDSISINLYKLLGSALNLNPERKTIVSQEDNFPTDLYVAQSFADANDCTLKLSNSADLQSTIDETVAVLLLTEVNFRSGARHDLQALTELAHNKGVIVIWDLAHSAGAVPLALDDWNVDFAVGCGYKFLNGGPGAPAFVYVAHRHQEHLSQPLKGWMGHATPFAFNSEYLPAEGPKQFLTGTPNVLSMIALNAALDLFKDLNMELVHKKSISLSELFISELDQCAALTELTLVSPRDARRRGSQIALSHPDAFAISQALIDQDIIVDYRDPDILRFGITPLYTSHEDIWHAVHALNHIMQNNTFKNPKYQTRQTVT